MTVAKSARKTNSSVLEASIAEDIGIRKCSAFKNLSSIINSCPFSELVLIGYGSPLVTVAKSSRIDDIYESEEEEERRYTQRMKEEKHIKVKLRTPLKGFRTKLIPKKLLPTL